MSTSFVITVFLTISVLYSINLASSTYYISTPLISLDTEPPTEKVAELSLHHLTTMQYLLLPTCRFHRRPFHPSAPSSHKPMSDFNNASRWLSFLNVSPFVIPSAIILAHRHCNYFLKPPGRTPGSEAVIGVWGSPFRAGLGRWDRILATDQKVVHHVQHQ